VSEAEGEKRKDAAEQLLVLCGVNKEMASQQQWQHKCSAGLHGTPSPEGPDAERREADGNWHETGWFRDSCRERTKCHLACSQLGINGSLFKCEHIFGASPQVCDLPRLSVIAGRIVVTTLPNLPRRVVLAIALGFR